MLDLAAISRNADDRDSADWNFARNDDQLGRIPGLNSPPLQFVEVRQREFLRTINGRSTEYSTSITSSIKRQGVQ